MDKAKAAAVILVCLMLAACAHSPIGLPCNVGPIYLDEDDRLTEATAKKIVGLNNTGADPLTCGWQPP